MSGKDGEDVEEVSGGLMTMNVSFSICGKKKKTDIED